MPPRPATSQSRVRTSTAATANDLPLVATSLPVSPRVKFTRAAKSHALTLRFSAPAGYYRFSAIADGSAFDWESLYYPLTLFKNTGQRSGPWDFDTRNNNKPLVPAYWVTCNGVKLGLWYFQRVSLQDMERRVFRGQCAFELAKDGQHTLKLEPYHDKPLPWLQARLEPKTDELPAHHWVEAIAKTTVQTQSDSKQRVTSPATLPIDQWNDPAYWQSIKQKLAGDFAWVSSFLESTFEWATKNDQPPKAALLPLVFKARLQEDHAALAKAISLIQSIVDLPHFGNPNPEGYGHNGDMAAADQLLNLALALHLLNNELSPAQQKAIVKKFAMQAEKFVASALINDDYWGGSVLQDHGWRSYMLFAAALLHMPNVHKQYPDLLAFALGRVQKSMNAMPRDGVIPWSSYGYLNLYLDAAAHLRQTLLASSNHTIDLYDQGPWHEIIHYLHTITDHTGQFMIIRAANQDEPPLIGGLAFCVHLAQKHHDGKALKLAALIAQRPAPQKFYCSPQAISYLHNPIHALTENWPAPDTLAPTPVPDTTHKKPRVDYFKDSGLVRYHNPKANLTLTLRCAPFAGWHAYQHTHGPCDRMHIIPDDGHFAILQNTSSLLASTEHGYRLRSADRSILLIDDQGQIGDVDYPMSIPSYPYPGQHIRSVSNNHVELDLTPAYPKERQLLAYTRKFLFLPRNTIHCVDTIALAKPAKLDWLFHSRLDHGLSLDGLRFGVASPKKLTIEPANTQLSHHAKLSAVILPTEVLWSYDSCTNWAPVAAVRYTTSCKVTSASVTFAMKYTAGR